MTDVFSRRTIIPRGEGVRGIADAIDIIEKLADLTAPSFRAGKRVVGHKVQVLRYVSLKMQRKGFVTRTIIGAKYGDVGKIITPVAMHAGLEGIVRAQNPVGIEGVLNAGGGVQRVRGMVIRIDQRGRAGSILDI